MCGRIRFYFASKWMFLQKLPKDHSLSMLPYVPYNMEKWYRRDGRKWSNEDLARPWEMTPKIYFYNDSLPDGDVYLYKGEVELEKVETKNWPKLFHLHEDFKELEVPIRRVWNQDEVLGLCSLVHSQSVL